MLLEYLTEQAIPTLHSLQTFVQHIHKDLHHRNARSFPISVIYSSLYPCHKKFFSNSQNHISLFNLNPFLLIYFTAEIKNSSLFSTHKYLEITSASLLQSSLQTKQPKFIQTSLRGFNILKLPKDNHCCPLFLSKSFTFFSKKQCKKSKLSFPAEAPLVLRRMEGSSLCWLYVWGNHVNFSQVDKQKVKQLPACLQ